MFGFQFQPGPLSREAAQQLSRMLARLNRPMRAELPLELRDSPSEVRLSMVSGRADALDSGNSYPILAKITVVGAESSGITMYSWVEQEVSYDVSNHVGNKVDGRSGTTNAFEIFEEAAQVDDIVYLYPAPDEGYFWFDISEFGGGSGGGGGTPTFSGARVYRTSYLTITAVGSYIISFQAERFDVGGYWTVSQPTRLTVPTTGYYLVGFSAELYTDSGANPFLGDASLGIIRNGVDILALQSLYSTSIDPHPQATTSVLTHLTAGDYVTAEVAHNSTFITTLEVVAAAQYTPEFWITLVGV